MKTLVNNATTGLMIGGGLVIVAAGIWNLGTQAAMGAGLLIACAIVKCVLK